MQKSISALQFLAAQICRTNKAECKVVTISRVTTVAVHVDRTSKKYLLDTAWCYCNEKKQVRQVLFRFFGKYMDYSSLL